MEQEKIKEIFEAYFEKYKKTEGDQTSWSAYWTETTPSGTLVLNMTKCPRGTVFKVFVDNRKVEEVIGWDTFFPTMEKIGEKYSELYDKDHIFSEMEFAV